MANWTLNDGASTKSLEEWGIANPTLVFRSLGADEFRFEIPRVDVLGAATFAYGTTLKLYKDDTLWYIGRVRQPQAAGSGARQGERYLVVNGWWDLEHLTFQQLRCLKTEDFSGTTTSHSSRVILGQSSVGLRKTTSQVVAEVMSYAFTKGASAVAGAILDGIAMPYQEARDITCAEAIQRMARRTPDAVSWFVYSSGSPVMNFRRRASLTAVEIDLDDADLVTEFEVTPRDDLVPSGVRFIFVTSETNPEDGKSYARQTIQTAGVPDAVGGIIATVELMGSGSDRPEKAPTAAALNYYTLLQTKQYEGTLTTVAAEVDGVLRPGKKLRLMGGRAEWETMDAVIQSVSESLYSGMTTAEFGPPEQLGPQDYVEQLMFNRQQLLATNFHAVRNCLNDDADEGDDPGEGVDPDVGADPDTNPNAGENAVANGGGGGGRRTADIETCNAGFPGELKVLIP